MSINDNNVKIFTIPYFDASQSKLLQVSPRPKIAELILMKVAFFFPCKLFMVKQQVKQYF